MSFTEPLVLFLVLPLAFLAALAWRRGDLLAAALPGQWPRVVAPSLRGFLARRMPERTRGQLGLCLTLAALLLVALARPAIEAERLPVYGNLSGRVLVLDLGAGGDLREQRLFAQRLIEQAPGVPTALVAVAADAFDVVPLTTDRRQVLRYLAALAPAVMPEPGRSLRLGLAQGEAVLRKAGIVAGQVILVTSGRPPARAEPASPADFLRAIAVMGPRTAAWAGYAAERGARLAGPAEFDAILRDLTGAVRDRARRRAAASRIELAPWIIGLALGLWLALFRRRAVS